MGLPAEVPCPRRIGRLRLPPKNRKLRVSAPNYKPASGVAGYGSANFAPEFLKRCHRLLDYSQSPVALTCPAGSLVTGRNDILIRDGGSLHQGCTIGSLYRRKPIAESKRQRRRCLWGQGPARTTPGEFSGQCGMWGHAPRGLRGGLLLCPLASHGAQDLPAVSGFRRRTLRRSGDHPR
jgi:hypothetical protein